MAIVYQHRRRDTNEVFYIGKGVNKRRAFTDKGRNKYWHNVVTKVGYEVDILETGLTLEEAAKREIELISKYGRKDKKKGNLVNMTDGGGGIVGYKFKDRPSPFKNKNHTEEAKHKNAKWHLGKAPGNKGKPSPYRGVKRPKHSEEMIGGKNSNAKKVFDVEQNKVYECMKDYMKQNGIANTKLQTLIKKQKLIII